MNRTTKNRYSCWRLLSGGLLESLMQSPFRTWRARARNDVTMHPMTMEWFCDNAKKKLDSIKSTSCMLASLSPPFLDLISFEIDMLTRTRCRWQLKAQRHPVQRTRTLGWTSNCIAITWTYVWPSLPVRIWCSSGGLQGNDPARFICSASRPNLSYESFLSQDFSQYTPAPQVIIRRIALCMCGVSSWGALRSMFSLCSGCHHLQ